MSFWKTHDGETRPDGLVRFIRRRDGCETSDILSGNWCWSKVHSAADVVGYLSVSVPVDAPFDAVSQQYLQRSDVLDAARQAVTVDRAATHGALGSSFVQIAAIWSVRLGVTITPAQVAILMIDLKTVRGWGNPGHFDNWVDIAGYAACGGELSGAAKP